MDIFLTILGVSSLKSIWNSVPDVLFLCMTFFNKVREDFKEKDINLVNLDPTKNANSFLDPTVDKWISGTDQLGNYRSLSLSTKYTEDFWDV